MNVIDLNGLEHDVLRKPLRTFRHHALGELVFCSMKPFPMTVRQERSLAALAPRKYVEPRAVREPQAWQGDGARVSGSDDRTRFANVVTPHLADAYALARWLTGNRADAEDVVQDACLRAYRGIRNFSGGNARAWVLTIVRHTAYTWLGKNRPAALVVVDDLEAVEQAQNRGLMGDDGTGPETPEAALIAKADAARLEAAIATLPTSFRETLVLRDLQNMEYREIAQVTGVPIGTVMSRLARARRRVIDRIAKDAP
jgi:RNA polymerase sigma-70 factor (ECF subfamily)